MGSIVSPQNSYIKVLVPQNVSIFTDRALKVIKGKGKMSGFKYDNK